MSDPGETTVPGAGPAPPLPPAPCSQPPQSPPPERPQPAPPPPSTVGASGSTVSMEVVLALPGPAPPPGDDARSTRPMAQVLSLPSASVGSSLGPTAAMPSVESWDPASSTAAPPPATEAPVAPAARAVDSQAITDADGRGERDPARASTVDRAGPVVVSLRRSDATAAAPAPSMALAIPGLRLGSELGRGAQGIVYRAARTAGGADVAVKLLRPEAGDDEVARFEQALVAMDALQGVAGVVQVHERGRTPLGQPWFSMDLVQGPSLRTALTDGLLPPRALVAVVADAARAVHDAHDRGIVHRDLKPENVLIDIQPDGACVARVADFGLARDLHAAGTRSIDAAGTLAYMAPEQVTGRELTRRTDLYALGAVLYEVITGAPPFRRPTPAAIAQAIVHEAPRPPATLWSGLPPTLARITLRALAKDPADRQLTAALLATQIERALAGDTLDDVAAPPPAASRAPGLQRAIAHVRARSRFLRGVALGVVLGVGLGWLAGTHGWGPSRAARKAPRAAPSRRR